MSWEDNKLPRRDSCMEVVNVHLKLVIMTLNTALQALGCPHWSPLTLHSHSEIKLISLFCLTVFIYELLLPIFKTMFPSHIKKLQNINKLPLLLSLVDLTMENSFVAKSFAPLWSHYSFVGLQLMMLRVKDLLHNQAIPGPAIHLVCSFTDPPNFLILL